MNHQSKFAVLLFGCSVSSLIACGASSEPGEQQTVTEPTATDPAPSTLPSAPQPSPTSPEASAPGNPAATPSPNAPLPGSPAPSASAPNSPAPSAPDSPATSPTPTASEPSPEPSIPSEVPEEPDGAPGPEPQTPETPAPANPAESGTSPGCGSSNQLERGTFSLDVEGTQRNYVLEVPANYDAAHAYPLVFVWHPLGGSASQVVRGGYDGLLSRADGSAVFVAPDGLEGMAAGINGQGWYNTDGGDMKFLSAMLEHFKDNLCIDTSRIFSTGFSFGGMMSYAIGCEFADVFRAIAPSSGNAGGSGCRQAGANPIAVLGLHGASDDFVATSGGRSARDLFLTRNNCGAETVPVDPSPCVEYQGCDAGFPVIWCEYSGGHSPWSQAPQTIWNFFSQF